MKGKATQGRNKYYSISKKLKQDKKINEEFEILFNALSLEEVIGLKLELASKFSFNGKLYGVPIWYSLSNIVKDAVLKYALSATKSKKEAARFLGLSVLTLRKEINRYKIDEYFEEKLKEDETIDYNN
mgnify:CR=1 FL=1